MRYRRLLDASMQQWMPVMSEYNGQLQLYANAHITKGLEVQHGTHSVALVCTAYGWVS
jgi:hypothetical protein